MNCKKQKIYIIIAAIAYYIILTALMKHLPLAIGTHISQETIETPGMTDTEMTEENEVLEKSLSLITGIVISFSVLFSSIMFIVKKQRKIFLKNIDVTEDEDSKVKYRLKLSHRQTYHCKEEDAASLEDKIAIDTINKTYRMARRMLR